MRSWCGTVLVAVAAFAAVATASAGLKTGDTKALALPGGAKMILIYCAPGEFMMGSDNGERDERPVHRVRLTHGFWMGNAEAVKPAGTDPAEPL